MAVEVGEGESGSGSGPRGRSKGTTGPVGGPKHLLGVAVGAADQRSVGGAAHSCGGEMQQWWVERRAWVGELRKRDAPRPHLQAWRVG